MIYEEVRSNIISFLVAGHDATTNTLHHTLYMLATHLDFQKKLREEILEQFPEDQLEYEKVRDCEMLMNVVKETTRLYPILYFLNARMNVEDQIVEGWHIPKGVRIMFPIWQHLRDKEVWGEDACEFKPERFNNLTPQQRKCYLSFGGGGRVCMGMYFSIMEQKILLIKLLKKYEILYDSSLTYDFNFILTAPNPTKNYFTFKPLENK